MSDTNQQATADTRLFDMSKAQPIQAASAPATTPTTTPTPAPLFDMSKAQPIQQPTAQPTGIVAGIKRNTVDALTGLYHAFNDPATEEEKTDLLQKIREQNAQGDKIPETLATNPSRATLALHRIVDAPAATLAKKSRDEVGVAKDLINNHEYWKGGNMYLSGLTDRLLSTVPVAGPAIKSIAERGERGDFSGAATDVASLVAMEHAPAVAEATGKASGRLSDAVAEKMYQSTLKPSPKSYTPAEVEEMVRTGLENKIPVSKAGVQKLDALVSDLNSKIAAEIKAGSANGATVNKFDVASRLGQTAKKFATQVNPEADLATVGDAGNEFLRNQPNEIPAADAQALKQGTYRQLGDKTFGELSSATKESQKALARGIKEELADQFPEIANLNAKEGKLLGLDDALEAAVNRTRNHNIIGLGTKIAAPIVGGAVGGGEGAAAGTGLAVMMEVLSHPAIQSRIAIGVSRASKIPFHEALGKVAAYAAALGTTQQSDEQDQNQE